MMSRKGQASGKLRKVAIGAAWVGMLSVLAVLAFSANGTAGSAPLPSNR
jgi:hypothetical protein